MQLPLRNFTQLVSDAAAAVQGSATVLIDLSVGSVLRALLEANAALALWLQWIAVLVLQASRASTSQGPDLDTWMADFGLARLAPVAATGLVTFGRYTPVAAAFVPVGALVRTGDAGQSFAVVADATNAAWDAANNGYDLAAGVASMNLPVAAVVPGAAGNVQAGAISLLASAMPGIDTVSNAAALTAGLDAEPDAVYRTRFQNWLSSRWRATPLAVITAVQGVQQGVQVVVVENQLPSGTPQMGCFVVVVNDGSGNPPSSLLANAGTAVDLVRPAGSAFSVIGPTVLSANVAMTITTLPGASHANAVAAVTAAVTAWINALPIGVVLPYARLMQLAFQASADVLNVTGVTLNGGTADLSPGVAGVVMAGTVTVS